MENCHVHFYQLVGVPDAAPGPACDASATDFASSFPEQQRLYLSPEPRRVATVTVARVIAPRTDGDLYFDEKHGDILVKCV